MYGFQRLFSEVWDGVALSSLDFNRNGGATTLIQLRDAFASRVLIFGVVKQKPQMGEGHSDDIVDLYKVSSASLALLGLRAGISEPHVLFWGEGGNPH